MPDTNVTSSNAIQDVSTVLGMNWKTVKAIQTRTLMLKKRIHTEESNLKVCLVSTANVFDLMCLFRTSAAIDSPC